jgi:transposase
MSHVQRADDVALESSFASSDRRTLTDVEVAARLGVSRFTVRSWRLKGPLEAAEKHRRLWAHIERHCVAGSC